MKTLAETLLRQVSAIIHSSTFLETARVDRRHFTRNRSLAFVSCVCLILARLTTSLRSELATFFENVLGKEESVTPQAFSKARRNIRHEAFRDIFEATRKTILNSRSIRRFRGYRVFAIDGSDMPLPVSRELRDAFRSANPSTPASTRAHASVMCDVLDGYVIDACFEPESVGERELAARHLDAYERFARPRDLIVMDRGYASIKFLLRLSELPGKYLLRVSQAFAAAFPDYVKVNRDCYVSLKHKGRIVRFRVVHATLSTGETEILVTNLSQTTMPPDALLELYNLRWGVETAFRNLKDRLSLVRFSGRSKQTVLQDFYACITFYNIACAFCARADVDRANRDKLRDLKHRYVANRSAAFAFIKRHLSNMLLFPRRLAASADRLYKELLNVVSSIRPGRSYPRSLLRSDHRAVAQRYPF